MANCGLFSSCCSTSDGSSRSPGRISWNWCGRRATGIVVGRRAHLDHAVDGNVAALGRPLEKRTGL
jgi:hypothetical protein